MSHPLDTAPCGECGALVSRVAGCPHWRPAAALARAVKARQEREQVSRRRRTAAATPHRQIGVSP